MTTLLLSLRAAMSQLFDQDESVQCFLKIDLLSLFKATVFRLKCALIGLINKWNILFYSFGLMVRLSKTFKDVALCFRFCFMDQMIDRLTVSR